jgi:hypothetical protein
MTLMKKITIVFVMLVLALSFAACGSAKEKLEEKSAEKIAENLIEQSTGAENVDIDLENQSVSVTDENGEGMAIESGDKVDLKTFSAMGYKIPLPDGVISGEVSRFTDEEGKETGVTGSFEVDASTDTKAFFQALDKSLTAQGLKFTDPFDPDLTEPDFSNIQPGQYFYYKDDKGISFFIASFGENRFTISGTEE